jgi:hypothetical protein
VSVPARLLSPALRACSGPAGLAGDAAAVSVTNDGVDFVSAGDAPLGVA